jgi:Fe-S cluster assembly protein SufD
MTAMQQKGAEGFLHRFEGLRRRLPGARLAWAAALRDEAAEAFRASGLPTRRIEAWRYTDLRAVGEAGFDEALTSLDDGGDLPAMRGAARAVFLDGRFRADLSHLDGVGYAVGNLASELQHLEGRIGALARPAEQPLAALNTMLFEDGLVVTVPAGVEGGVLDLLSAASSTERPSAFHPRHLIRLEAGASLTLIETATGPEDGRYLHNPVFEIEVGEGATLSHARLQQEGPRAFQLSTVYARVAAGGTYDNFTLNAGAQLVRNEIHTILAGPKGACHMNGAQLLGAGQHADTTTFLDHAAPDCASRQTYKTVLAGKSRGVFQGKILVRQPAQRTDGYQMNQALFLSPDAEIDSKPQLEIYADDVKCSHGATVGELDAEQLFYLRSRGIPDSEARAMLVEAFLTEAVEGVADPAARGALEAAVSGWWDRQMKDAA